MTRHLGKLLAVIVGLGAIACGEERESSPAAPSVTAPSFARGGSGTLTCDFSKIKNLATKYFTNSTQRQLVGNLVNQMKQAFADDDYSATVKGYGFDIMAQLAIAVRNNRVGTGSQGSDLTNNLIVCMFHRTAETGAYPVTFPESFSTSLSPSLHGAYEVRGGATDPTDPVLSRPISAPFSGVAPLQTSTWPGMLSGNPAPSRVLLYGQPGSTSTSYVWKMVPHNADFAPPGIVGLCTEDPAAMVAEDGDLLHFEDAYFLVPGACSPTALLNERWNPFRLATGLFSPRALWANSFNPGGLGGSTGGIRSEYGPEDVVVNLSFVSQPQDANVGAPIPTSPSGGLKVQHTSAAGFVPGTAIILQAVANNGATVILTSTLATCSGDSCSAPADAVTGIANFGTLTLNKPGAYSFAASGSVAGRPGVPVNGATSNQFNVRP